jgi:hypothetical protein
VKRVIRVLAEVSSVNAICVDLKYHKLFDTTGFSVQLELLVPSSLLACLARYIFEQNGGAASSLRQNGIKWDRLARKVCQDEPSQRIKMYMLHNTCSTVQS